MPFLPALTRKIYTIVSEKEGIGTKALSQIREALFYRKLHIASASDHLKKTDRYVKLLKTKR